MNAAEKMAAMRDKEAESEAYRNDYDACKLALIDQGWTADELAELQGILLIDLADGPGVERPFPLAKDERRALWWNWFKEKVTPAGAAGINQRIRASQAEKKAA